MVLGCNSSATTSSSKINPGNKINNNNGSSPTTSVEEGISGRFYLNKEGTTYFYYWTEFKLIAEFCEKERKM